MPLKGRDYLVVALGCVAAGLWLSSVRPALFGKDSDSYEFIVVMAFSVLCLWSSLKFLVINRRRSDGIYLIIALSPVVLAALYVTYEYLSHVIETYYFIYRHRAFW